jgi:hypothetical protein
MLSVLRGDTDLIASNLDSVQQLVDQGDLRVVLQIADGPINDDPAMSNVAWLGGPEGWAARRASELGRDRDSAMSDARALIDFAGAGIIVCAPKGLPDELLECLRGRLHDAASSSGFQSAARGAKRTPEVASGERAQADLSAAEQYVTRFAPIVGNAFRRARK